jgi:hypothetical protein
MLSCEGEHYNRSSDGVAFQIYSNSRAFHCEESLLYSVRPPPPSPQHLFCYLLLYYIFTKLLRLSAGHFKAFNSLHRVNWPLSGVRTFHHDGKISPAWWGWGGGCTPPPVHFIYHHKQSCGVRSSWDGWYAPPIFSSTPICTLWVVPNLEIKTNLAWLLFVCLFKQNIFFLRYRCNIKILKNAWNTTVQ